MRIALDAMGSESAPSPEVEGALVALEREPDLEVVFIGTKKGLKPFTKIIEANPRLDTVVVEQVISMSDAPSEVVKTKGDSSIAVGIKMLKERKVDGFVSAGNTGAVVAFSLFSLGRIQGVHRPALATPFPTPSGQTVVLDVGANVDSKPEHLRDYALMGALMVGKIDGIKKPRVGLLNVGEEEKKGNQMVQEAYKLLTDSSLNFVGNVEGSRVFTGKADVVVTDGFTGNVMLKAMEGMGAAVLSVMKNTGKKYRLRGWLSKKVFKDFIIGLNYEKAGGAILLGVRGPVIISHGHSSARAIKNAVRLACFVAREGLVDAIAEEFK
ncbi:phosphate acyltransferase PlsX [candidate division WOR-3 bacterium]|uniref:Phosphate acyltransferase n=1 Tax=candidate division WOR-3 bacterium TaxID=2052148 RepID=A0A9D5K9Y6_UNCW3|nr:phosphate acyltransferase PlsX [candidate division WOR-3 bacterium]MBD3364854.1 phosphate acyltransferase PlsX [candidate division WOR-3 bacterium]